MNVTKHSLYVNKFLSYLIKKVISDNLLDKCFILCDNEM